jgi:hypothetical protein
MILIGRDAVGDATLADGSRLHVVIPDISEAKSAGLRLAGQAASPAIAPPWCAVSIMPARIRGKLIATADQSSQRRAGSWPNRPARYQGTRRRDQARCSADRAIDSDKDQRRALSAQLEPHRRDSSEASVTTPVSGSALIHADGDPSGLTWDSCRRQRIESPEVERDCRERGSLHCAGDDECAVEGASACRCSDVSRCADPGTRRPPRSCRTGRERGLRVQLPTGMASTRSPLEPGDLRPPLRSMPGCPR